MQMVEASVWNRIVVGQEWCRRLDIILSSKSLQNPVESVTRCCFSRVGSQCQYKRSHCAVDVVPDDRPVEKSRQQGGCLEIVQFGRRKFLEGLPEFIRHQAGNAPEKWRQ